MSSGTARLVRVGAVSFLNARPLVHGLERGLGAGRIELSFDVPSALAPRLDAGELDVALLPVIELGRREGLEIVPGLGITTRGAARSVLLVSPHPLESIASVALDADSSTSNALAQVLFAEVWFRRPAFVPGPADLGEALRQFDAAVRIGDKALCEPVPAGCSVWDLGTAWTEATGLPFVFATWSARAGIVDRELYRLLHDSRRSGVRAARQIADAFRWNGTPVPELARTYLTEHIRYRLGAAEVLAIETFLAAAERLGLIPRAPRLRMALERETACHEAARQLGLPDADLAEQRP